MAFIYNRIRILSIIYYTNHRVKYIHLHIVSSNILVLYAFHLCPFVFHSFISFISFIDLLVNELDRQKVLTKHHNHKFASPAVFIIVQLGITLDFWKVGIRGFAVPHSVGEVDNKS